MSNRTDLFKALNNFMAVLAAYAPGSHREDVVLEVGDAAFRAFEWALDDKHMSERRLIPEKPTGPCVIEWHSQSGRVVIRKRQTSRDEREAQLEREKAANLPTPIVKPCCERDTDGDGNCDRHKTVISASTPPKSVPVCGFRSPEGLACMKYEGHAFEHVVGDAPSSTCGLPLGHIEMEPLTDDELRQPYCPPEEKAGYPGVMREQSTCRFRRSHESDYHDRGCPMRGDPDATLHILPAAPPPEETKPPARAHRVDCTQPDEHDGDCYGLRPRGHPPARAHLNGCMFDADHAGKCCVPYGELTTVPTPPGEPESKPPALSPRQALGEALACVERAERLVGDMTTGSLRPMLALLRELQSAAEALRTQYEDTKP